MIEYADRYKYIKEADIIISATSGPHFTITKEHISESCKGDKKVFADLALPCDIDEGISEISGVYYYNLDDMKEIARENNEKKRLGIEQAEIMVDEGVEKFLKWALFQENLDVFEKIRESLEKEVLRVGEKRAIEHLFYKIRDRGSLEALRSIIDVFSE